MTDGRINEISSKYDRDGLKKSEVKQEYVNKFVTHVEKSCMNDINW
jgi:hypothetical protein